MFFKRFFVFLVLFSCCFLKAQVGTEGQLLFPPELIKGRDIPKLIVISLEKQFLAMYEYGELIVRYPISSGKRFKPTPVGKFNVIEKQRNGFSSIYDAPMPWTLALNGFYAIHAGQLPGYPDSHGCIRLNIEDAEQLFYWAELRTPIWIVGSLGDFVKNKAP